MKYGMGYIRGCHTRRHVLNSRHDTVKFSNAYLHINQAAVSTQEALVEF